METHVWLFPYLILQERQRIGPWRMVPRRLLRKQDARAKWVFEAAAGLGALYEAAESGDVLRFGRVGCFVARVGRATMGEEHDAPEMLALRRAVIAAVLDGNPMTSANGDGHAVATSDNATLYGHRVQPQGHVSAEYGVMVRTLEGGYTIGDKRSFRAPAELHLPLFGTTLDTDYGTASYGLLRNNDALAGRLGRATDWLDLAWRNTKSIELDLRVMSLRSGFEVLFAEDKTFSLAPKLSALLDPPNEPKKTRHYTDLQGRPKSAAFTDLEWWFIQFSFLRNEIAHGNPTSSAAYSFNGESHIMLAERALRSAIKATVKAAVPARLGRLLEYDVASRGLRRLIASAIRKEMRMRMARRQQPTAIVRQVLKLK